jgi:type IV pilus assembly protein PilA
MRAEASMSGNPKASIVVGVAISCGLALVTSSCMRGYLNAAKTAEARMEVGTMARSAAQAYDVEHMDPLAPGKPTTYTHSLCKSTSLEWTSDPPETGFTCLRFTIETPQYFMYSYSITGKGSDDGDTYSAVAEGDLNGDGVTSKFEMTGKVSGGAVVSTPGIKETNPTE